MADQKGEENVKSTTQASERKTIKVSRAARMMEFRARLLAGFQEEFREAFRAESSAAFQAVFRAESSAARKTQGASRLHLRHGFQMQPLKKSSRLLRSQRNSLTGTTRRSQSLA